MAGQYDLQLDPKFKKMAFDLNEPEMSYNPKTDLSISCLLASVPCLKLS